MASDIKEAIRRMIYQYTVEGADKVRATQEAVAASTTQTEKSSLSLEKAFGSLERRYVDTVRSQQDYQKVQERVNAAVAQNPALQERANVVLAQAKQHFDNVATGAGKADMAATVLIRTMSRTIGPLAAVGVAVAAISSAMEFMEPIAVRVGKDIYNRFSQAYPATAQFADGLAKVVQQFIETEHASAKIEATNAALKGVASSAELAALKLQSVNEKLVSQRGMAEAALAAERMANAILSVAAKYPGITLDTAKQLALLDAQLAVVQAQTDQESLLAEEKKRTLELTLEGVSAEEAALRIAKERAINEAKTAKSNRENNPYYSSNQTEATNAQYKAQTNVARATDDTAQATNNLTGATDHLANSTGNLAVQFTEVARSMNSLNFNVWWSSYRSISDQVDSRLSLMRSTGSEQHDFSYDPLFTATQKAALEAMYGAENIEPFYSGVGNNLAGYRVKQSYLATNVAAYVGQQDVSSPAAIQQSLANVLSLGLENGLGNINRLIDVVTDKGQQASLIQQTIDYIQATQPAGLGREEMIAELTSKLQSLTSSTDSLNATMQNALSPYYSQDPRTTHLGFRAGTMGNPDWAAVTNPLDTILGAGATAPGMADGGSFVVGGGYSANDNMIAAFPVASGEQVIVNRNRAKGEGGQVIHIDNRTIINGSLDADTLGKLKVSRFQQMQRMRASLAS
jgi:hypothetical protein